MNPEYFRGRHRRPAMGTGFSKRIGKFILLTVIRSTRLCVETEPQWALVSKGIRHCGSFRARISLACESLSSASRSRRMWANRRPAILAIRRHSGVKQRRLTLFVTEFLLVWQLCCSSFS